jgi:long-chain acyl-CoA synthetase
MNKDLKHNYPLYEVKEFTDFKDMIWQHAEREPNKIAFRYTVNKEDRQVTYKQHYENMNAMGTALADAGYHGIHIAMVGENCYEWALMQITVLASDNVYVPIDKELPMTDLLNVINHSDSKVVFCTGSFAKSLAENRDKIPNVDKIFVFRAKEELPEGLYSAEEFMENGRELYVGGNRSYMDQKPADLELGELVYTSGTTGAPKGVMLSRHNLWASVYYGLMEMKVFDVGLSVLPYNHTYESTCDLLVSQHYGSTICINENLKTVADNLKKYKPEYVMLVPLFVETFYKKIWKTLEKSGKADLVRKMMKVSNGLRKVGIDVRKKLFKQILEVFGGNMIMIVCGGAPIRPEIAAFFDAIGISLINGYGITECAPLLSCNRQYYNDFRSVGVPLPCVQVRIEDPNEDGEGEIVVKGDIVMMGYYKNEEATKEVLTEDGWFATGDYGKMVRDQLFITGRKKNLIVLKNGKNVYPEEIEDYIMSVEGVEEVIVYSNVDENGDEVSLCAEIYPAEDHAKGKSEDELLKYFKAQCREVCASLPSYKQIANVVIRKEEFPHTTSRKIKRMEVLKERRG